jgi:hypothetical protein
MSMSGDEMREKYVREVLQEYPVRRFAFDDQPWRERHRDGGFGLRVFQSVFLHDKMPARREV